jgi:zinc finger protein
MEEAHGDAGSSQQQGPLFKGLAADEKDVGVTEIESLCMECERNGMTRLLLTKIPMFKEVVVSSFQCLHCGASNSSIQSGAAIEDRGVKYTFRVQEIEHLNRLIVKADTASLYIPELDFEIPAHSQEGSITTIESILIKSVEGLEKEQPVRKALHPDLAAKLDVFIGQLKMCAQLKHPFTVVIDDPAGNSYIENKLAPHADPQLNMVHYVRSEQQNKQLGAVTATKGESSSSTTGADGSEASVDEMHVAGGEAEPISKDEVVSFPTNCSHCNSPTETRMKLVDIPHFKQVVIMATTCSYCGYKSNEVKSGSGVSETGTRIKLKLAHISDLSRDLVQVNIFA